MRIAVCDDEVQYCRQTVQAIDGCMKSIDIVTDVFDDGHKFLQAFQKNSYDLVFLDIEMPAIDGISLARRLRELSRDVYIVFLTSHIEYALEGYEVEALRYLTKPICDKVFDKIVSELTYNGQCYIDEDSSNIGSLGIDEQEEILVELKLIDGVPANITAWMPFLFKKHTEYFCHKCQKYSIYN